MYQIATIIMILHFLVMQQQKAALMGSILVLLRRKTANKEDDTMEIKLPLYNILNMFLTGLVFIGGCVLLFPQYIVDLFNNEIIKGLSAGPEIVITVCIFAIAYETGLIINRIGSTIIEPVFKKTKLIPFNDNYSLFNEKKKQYPIMSTLSREYALSRTGIVLFLLLAVLALFSSTKLLSIPLLIIAIIFYVSCRKHAGKIVKLMSDSHDN